MIHVLRRYRNRRLYDPILHQYVNLGHIRDLVKREVPFKVEDADTWVDITEETLLNVYRDGDLTRGLMRDTLLRLIREQG